MLYSGHFSFDEIGGTTSERHGYFSCIVNAVNPVQALEKFKQRIREIKQEIEEPFFADILAVYVEDIVEISEIPDDAVVTRFQSSEGPFPKSRSCSLPTSDTVKIKAFQWVPGSEEAGVNFTMKDSEGYQEAMPFLRFS